MFVGTVGTMKALADIVERRMVVIDSLMFAFFYESCRRSFRIICDAGLPIAASRNASSLDYIVALWYVYVNKKLKYTIKGARSPHFQEQKSTNKQQTPPLSSPCGIIIQ